MVLDGRHRFLAALLRGALLLAGPATLGFHDLQPAADARELLLMARGLALEADDGHLV